jgi:membrane protein YdbS with pleckstrin-like domain
MELQPTAFVYMAFRRMTGALIIGLMIGVFSGGFTGTHVPQPHEFYVNWLFLIIVAVFAILSFPAVLLYTWFLARSYRIDLGKDGISLKYGVLTTTNELMPYGRIQDFVISQGILGRLMSLVTIKIQNAMGKPIIISGCSPEDAETLRNTAMTRAKPA